MSKWLFITRPEFWEDLKPPNNNWIYRRDDKRIKSGDNAIIYVSRFGFITSAIEILEPIKPRNRVSSFPYKTSIKFIITLPEKKYISLRDYIKELNLFKNKTANWGSSLQKSILSLSDEDYLFLFREIKEKLKS